MDAENGSQTNQKELYNQKESYRALTENSPDVIMRYDREYRHLFVNSRVEEILGIPHKSFINKTHEELGFPKHQCKLFGEAIEMVFQTETDHHIELNLENGKWFDWILFPEFNEAGQVIAVTTSARDISQLKRMEAQLIKARDDAEEAARAKSDFLATMGHEIRTPMNAIIALTHLMLKTELSNKQYNYVNKIDQSAQDLLHIINDILDFSTIEAGKINIEQIDFNLNQVLDQLANRLAKEAEKKQLTLTSDVQKDTPNILIGDPLRLGQILLNLAENAIKFTNQGGIAIRVEKLHHTKNGITLKFSVRDTGIGLSMEEQKKLFASFQQVDPTDTRRYRGTGLGLAISKKLAKLMGGEIGVTSKLNSGSTFFFTAHFGLSEEDETDSLKGANILLVEDNDIHREVIAELLTDQGFQVAMADNGAEAISFINHKKDEEMYDAVLMELQMPVMDGYTAATILREYSRFDNLPIIAITDSMDEAKNPTTDAIDAYIVKPIQPKTMLQTLAQWTTPGVRNQNQTSPSPSLSNELNLKGIDTKSALTRLNGNMDGYKRILNKFTASENDFFERLQTALLADRMDDAIRMAHTLKGVAANIGAMDLSMTAADLEKALKRSEYTRAEVILTRLNEELREILNAIHDGLSPIVKTHVSKIDSTKVSELLNNLSVQIDDYDASASETCVELTRHISQSETPSKVLELQRALDNYDFSLARECFFEIQQVLVV